MTTEPTTPLPTEQLPPTHGYAQPPTDHSAHQQPQQQVPHPHQPAYVAQQPRPAATRSAQATKVGETNTFALLAIVLAFIQPIAAIVFGHMSLSQIKRTGDAGKGLAVTGLVIGYVYFAFLISIMVIYVSFIAIAIATLGSGVDSLRGSTPDFY